MNKLVNAAMYLTGRLTSFPFFFKFKPRQLERTRKAQANTRMRNGIGPMQSSIRLFERA